MPNWTTNYVYIEGEKEAISRIREAVKTEGEGVSRGEFFDFEEFIPMPNALKGIVSPTVVTDTQEEADAINADWSGQQSEERRAITKETARALKSEHGATNWYDWSIMHWGTKWNSNACEVLLDEPDKVALRFDTAWSEPVGILRHLDDMEGVRTVEYVAMHEGGEDPTYSMNWGTYFEVETETEEFDDYTYTHTYVVLSADLQTEEADAAT